MIASDRVRSRLLEAAAETAGADRSTELDVLLERYYRHVAVEDLLDRNPEDLLGAALAHRDLAARHRTGEDAAVRVFTPTVAEQKWSCGHTVLQMVTDDMPFLVDSVLADLARQDRRVHLVIHPQLVVRRSEDGRLLEVLDVDPESVGDVEAGPGEVVDTESWMHVEVDRESDQQDLGSMGDRARRVLADVRAAVHDWPAMRGQIIAIADDLDTAPPPGVPEAEVAQAVGFLRWLADHFTLLGYREYTLDDEDALVSRPETGLGILRQGDGEAPVRRLQLTGSVRAKAREPHVLIITKANSRATVHRSAYLDYIGIKEFDDQGAVVGERRVLGLFTSDAYTESVFNVPVLGAKVMEVLALSGYQPDGHDGRDLVGLLQSYPRDELFQTETDELVTTAKAILHASERRQARLFVRRDVYGRFYSVLVYLPKDRYTTTTRLRIEGMLREVTGSTTIDYATTMGEGLMARLHYVVRLPTGSTLPELDQEDLERRMIEVTRAWGDELGTALAVEHGEEEGGRLAKAFAGGFPEAYKEDFSPRVAVIDLAHLVDLQPDGLALNLYQPLAAPPHVRRMKVYRREPLSLSRILPFFTHLGLEVTDERPYHLTRLDGTSFYVYDFGLSVPDAAVWQRPGARLRVQDALADAWHGRVESDDYNGLVLGSGLTSRQVVILRAVSRYLRQAGTQFSAYYLAEALLANGDLARLLVELFQVRFDPDASDEGRSEREAAVVAELRAGLDQVASLDQDRIVRSFLAVIQASLRTNYFQVDEDGRPKPCLSIKLDPQAIAGLPEPRPEFEIWVYGPRVEGVHLRFGPVARGGLRWSDRREDFRTEILGLVKAQMVKNAVIVPTGSKGGFFAKQLPDPAVDRDAWLQEGIGAYTFFISGLLDLTDNRVGTDVVAPDRVVRHDDDDPYLVVAADKGTATFSDIANSVAQDYGFWLDDAFASGGSAGYDHKGMGITARGAWESVKRHFRELGVDTQTEDFTVVGVGDMSGDVFGNGMLLSEHIRLVGAFDHRHIVIDPDPDAAASYAERRRLFDLPRSSWDDYDRSLLSEGGGIYPRSAKSISLSHRAAVALGLREAPADGEQAEPGESGDSGQRLELTPAELMRAVLLAPVDLLWNGGIGTYVKASTESNADVGDRANDAIRVNGADLRVKVVGEGGNLGATQLGRIEAALAGVQINTDAIDNSAGVDTSDHEVNLKILLTEQTRAGNLTLTQRNNLLASMTDEVGAMVLRDNYEQNVLLGNARAQEVAMAPVHQRLMHWLEDRGELNRALEFLPSDAELEARIADGKGLASPEFAVLVAYAKLAIKADLTESDLVEQPFFETVLRHYFPHPIRERFDAEIGDHPLRTAIIVNAVANSMVNRGGISFAFRTSEESGATTAQVARAYVIAREVFDQAAFVDQVEALDTVVPTGVQTQMYLEFRRLMDRATRWFLQSRPLHSDIESEIDRFAESVHRFTPVVPDLLGGAERARLEAEVERLMDQGVPADLARRVASLLDCFSLLDIVEIAHATGRDVDLVAATYFLLSERFEVDALLTRVSRLPREDRWDALARGSLRDDLYTLLASLTTAVLEAAPDASDAQEGVEAWASANAEGLGRARTALKDIDEVEGVGIAPLSVALRTLRGVIRSGSAH